MTKYNTNFELDLNDIELIETSLRTSMRNGSEEIKKEAHMLLGKLHNQKEWYVPKEDFIPRG